MKVIIEANNMDAGTNTNNKIEYFVKEYNDIASVRTYSRTVDCDKHLDYVVCEVGRRMPDGLLYTVAEFDVTKYFGKIIND